MAWVMVIFFDGGAMVESHNGGSLIMSYDDGVMEMSSNDGFVIFDVAWGMFSSFTSGVCGNISGLQQGLTSLHLEVFTTSRPKMQ